MVRHFHPISFLIFLFYFIIGTTQATSIAGDMQQQNAHQQERQKALQSQLDTVGKDVRSEPFPGLNQPLKFVNSSSCLKIKRVLIEKGDDIPHWLPLQRIADNAIDHCMNAQNIKVTAIILQNKLIASGYITSRIDLPKQNVKNGELKIKVISGSIGRIYLQKGADKYVHISNTFPTHDENILDLRDIEQGLENMQGIPGTDVHINLIPAAEGQKTDIAIDRYQHSFWRVTSWVDDTGGKSTGRYQAGIALYLDNPTSLNDLFYISATHDLHNRSRFGSKSSSLNYTVPYGYWSFNLYASESQYHQALSGTFSDFQYRGKNRVMSGKINRVLHRGAQQKTTLSTQVIKRNANYHVADVELELQRVDITNLRFDLAHRHYIRDAVIDADLGFQRNVRGFGSQQPQATSDIVSDSSRIITLDLQAMVPFQLAGMAMSWQPHYYQQYTPDTLITQDQLSIGNRWSVRGFDGENTLIGNNGWYLSNTINIDLPPSWNNQLYAGIDYGQVSRINQNWVPGHAITGGVLGIRVVKWQTSYDFFAGIPIEKPHEMMADNFTLGFALQWMY